MQVVKVILYVLLGLSSVGLIAVVLMQEGQSGGLGAMVGGESEGFGQNTTRSRTQVLKLYTKIAAGAVFVLCLGLVIMEKFL